MREKGTEGCSAVRFAGRFVICRPQGARTGKENTAPCHFQYIERRGACGKTGVMAHHRPLEREPAEMGGTMTEHAVVIAGGGPTGLMLAGELALAGVNVAIVDRRASQDLLGSRAGGFSPRTIEVLR